MTTGTKTATVFVTVLCGLLLTILGVSEQWPFWAWLALAVLLAGTPATAFRLAAVRRGPYPVELTEHTTAPPVERSEEHISRVALPSLWPDYDFLFSATVRWYPREAAGAGRVLHPAGLAVEVILDCARELTKQREPGQVSYVQHELNGILGALRPDRSGYLQVMAEGVTLALPAQDQERLERLAAVRKEQAVWEHQRKYEQSRRGYLGDDVFKDTGSAVVWSLVKNDEDVAKTVADLEVLARFTSAANDTDIPERLAGQLADEREARRAEESAEAPVFVPPQPEPEPAPEPSAADRYDDFLDSIGLNDATGRRLVTKMTAEAVRSQGKSEAADDMLRRHDPPAQYTAEEEPAEAGSDPGPEPGIVPSDDAPAD